MKTIIRCRIRARFHWGRLLVRSTDETRKIAKRIGPVRTATSGGGTYHVRVVPVSGGRVGRDHVLVVAVVVDYALHAGPRVLDVVEVSP